MTTKTATILTRTEPEVKEKADKLFARLGLTTSGAINIFLHQSLEQQGMPFRIQIAKPNIPDLDSFSKEEVMHLLEQGIEEVKDGKTKPFEEVVAELEGEYGVHL